MSESTHLDPGVSGFGLPTYLDRRIVLKDESVNLSGLSPKMVQFLNACEDLHDLLFEQPLCVTSGHDGQHAPGSKHFQYKAVDVRCTDVDRAGQILFLACLAYICTVHAMAIFDERALPGAGHIHIEEAG
jgi:hypothetical protein